MSFNKSEHIGRPAPGVKKASFQVPTYKVVMRSTTGGGSQSITHKLVKDINDNDFVLNTPASPRVIVKVEMESYNVTRAWSAGGWNGVFRIQYESPFTNLDTNWDYTESPNCTDEDKIINNPKASQLLDIANMSNAVQLIYSITNTPITFTTCESFYYRTNTIVQFPGLNENDITINNGVAGLVSIEKL